MKYIQDTIKFFAEAYKNRVPKIKEQTAEWKQESWSYKPHFLLNISKIILGFEPSYVSPGNMVVGSRLDIFPDISDLVSSARLDFTTSEQKNKKIKNLNKQT